MERDAEEEGEHIGIDPLSEHPVTEEGKGDENGEDSRHDVAHGAAGPTVGGPFPASTGKGCCSAGGFSPRLCASMAAGFDEARP